MPTAKPGHRKYAGPWTLAIASYFIIPGAFFLLIGLGAFVSLLTQGSKPISSGVATGSNVWIGLLIGTGLVALAGLGLMAYALRRYTRDKAKLQLQK